MRTCEWWRSGVICLVLAAGLLVAGDAVVGNSARAQVLENRDDVVRSVTIKAKSMRRQLDVQAGGSIRDFCADGCVIRIDEDVNRDFLIEGNERLSIEGGLVYFDGVMVETSESDAAAQGAQNGDGRKQPAAQ